MVVIINRRDFEAMLKGFSSHEAEVKAHREARREMLQARLQARRDAVQAQNREQMI
jgi:hypothetical protein